MQEDSSKSKYFYALRDYLLGLLKKLVTKKIFITIFGIANPAGIWAWVVGKGASLAWDYFVEPFILWGIRRGFFVYDVQAGKAKLKRIEKAKREGNEEDYNRNMDDV